MCPGSQLLTTEGLKLGTHLFGSSSDVMTPNSRGGSAPTKVRVLGRRARAASIQAALYGMSILIRTVVAFILIAVPGAMLPQGTRPILAVFAHPDDERVIGPLLSRLAREGRET